VERITDFNNWNDLMAAFTAWWLDRGDASRSAAFNLATRTSAEPMQMANGVYDLDDLMEKLDVYLQQKARLVEWLPACSDFVHQAQAFAVETTAIGKDGKKRNWSEQKMLVEGRCHGFLRVQEALKRLDATLELRIDALRTIIATERERMRSEMQQPRRT